MAIKRRRGDVRLSPSIHWRQTTMSRVSRLLAAAALGLLATATFAQDKPPAYTTVKVEGTDNVYAFTYGNRVSVFVVTSAGVLATDPGGYGQPQRVPTYLEEIRK